MTHLSIASHAIGFFNQVESQAAEIISALPAMSDEEVWGLRIQARSFGTMAWRIECACDAEIMNRESVRRGRGVKDVEQRGIDAAVRKHAYEIGVEPRTVYRNAAIHRTFFNSDTDVRNNDLAEKDFYLAALAADDPREAIENFAQEKTKNPFFAPRDAWRQVKEKKTPPLDESVPALCDEPEVVAAFQAWERASIELMRLAPRLQGLINGYREEVGYELTVPSQSVRQTIFDLIRQGWDEADQIAVRMNRDRIHVIVWLNRLCELGEMVSFEKQRAPGARGAARTGYKEL